MRTPSRTTPDLTLAPPTWTWASGVVVGGIQLLLALLISPDSHPWPWYRLTLATAGCVVLVMTWSAARERVELGPEALGAVRGLRRWTVPWDEVVAVDLVPRRFRPDAVTVRRRTGPPVTALVRRSWLIREDTSLEANHGTIERELRRQSSRGR